MKICPSCSARFSSSDWHCPACGGDVAAENGVMLFAPEIARESTGFNPGYYAELARLEAGNFWFRARNRLIVQTLRKCFPHAGRFLEVGCGTGYVLSGVAQAFPNMTLVGSELFPQGLAFAANRVPHASMIQMDARAIPFQREFDVIGAFDVLEHVEEDERVLLQMHQAVVDGGSIMLTVPQHRFLWSRQDEYACHVRRYSAKELRDKVERAGFSVTRMTSFVTFLLPLMYLARRRKRAAGMEFDPLEELRIGGFVNAALSAVLTIEATMIGLGVSLPAGGSLLMIAMKK